MNFANIDARLWFSWFCTKKMWMLIKRFKGRIVKMVRRFETKIN